MLFTDEAREWLIKVAGKVKTAHELQDVVANAMRTGSIST